MDSTNSSGHPAHAQGTCFPVAPPRFLGLPLFREGTPRFCGSGGGTWGAAGAPPSQGDPEGSALSRWAGVLGWGDEGGGLEAEAKSMKVCRRRLSSWRRRLISASVLLTSGLCGVRRCRHSSCRARSSASEARRCSRLASRISRMRLFWKDRCCSRKSRRVVSMASLPARISSSRRPRVASLARRLLALL